MKKEEENDVGKTGGKHDLFSLKHTFHFIYFFICKLFHHTSQLIESLSQELKLDDDDDDDDDDGSMRWSEWPTRS